jgi:hypothetical protein
MKYNEMTFGRMEAILNKLGGKNGVNRFLAGEVTLKAVSRTFNVWKTIKVGTFTAENLFETLQKSCRFAENGGQKIPTIRHWASQMLMADGFTLKEKQEDVDLVLISVADLGFKQGAPSKEVYKWAEELGLSICYPEVGLQLLLQCCNDKPRKNEEKLDFTIAMDPIRVDEENQGSEMYVFRMQQSRFPAELKLFDLLEWDISDFFTETHQLVFQLSRKVVLS